MTLYNVNSLKLYPKIGKHVSMVLYINLNVNWFNAREIRLCTWSKPVLL